MLDVTQRPAPTPSPESQPFWDGCANELLLLQRCSQCQTYRHPPNPICPACLSSELEWVPASGRGIVYTFSVVQHAFRRAWQPLVPYVLAVIELAEGPRLLSNVVEVPPEEVRIGMDVELVFAPTSEATKVPLFRPAAKGEKS
jgi:uncharacterized protein